MKSHYKLQMLSAGREGGGGRGWRDLTLCNMLLNQYPPRPLFSDPRSGHFRSSEISISLNRSISKPMLNGDRLLVDIYNSSL